MNKGCCFHRFIVSRRRKISELQYQRVSDLLPTGPGWIGMRDAVPVEILLHRQVNLIPISTIGRFWWLLSRYVRRRAREGFRAHVGETDAQIVSELVQGAKAELEVVKRQSMVYSLYARRQKSIMVSFSPSQSARLVKWCNGLTSKLHPSTVWTERAAVGICGKFKAALSHALANSPLVCTRALGSA